MTARRRSILKAAAFRWPAVLCASRHSVSSRRQGPQGSSAFRRFAAACKLRHGANAPVVHVALAGEACRFGWRHERAVTDGTTVRLGARPFEGIGRSPLHERMPVKAGVCAPGMEPGSPDTARCSRAGIAARRPPRGFCATVHGDASAVACDQGGETEGARNRLRRHEAGRPWRGTAVATCLHALNAPRHERDAEMSRALDACSSPSKGPAGTGAAVAGRVDMTRSLRPPANPRQRIPGTPKRPPRALEMPAIHVRAAPLPAHDPTPT